MRLTPRERHGRVAQSITRESKAELKRAREALLPPATAHPLAHPRPPHTRRNTNDEA
jgi:hypothetical protein